MKKSTFTILILLFVVEGLVAYSMYLNYRLNHEKTIEYVEKPIIINQPQQPVPIDNPLSTLKDVPPSIDNPLSKTPPKGKKVSSLVEKSATIIKKFEGCFLNAYPDPKTGGKPITIGYGSTINKNGIPFKMGDRITKKEAEELLDRQLERDYIPFIQRIPYWNQMDENKKVALVSFGYNIGKGFYGDPKCQTITKHLTLKNWTKIPEVLTLYSNPKDKNVHKGLLRRRETEGKIWSSTI